MRRRPCGSGLARECVGTVNLNVECDGLIASKLAPTGFKASMTSPTMTETEQ